MNRKIYIAVLFVALLGFACKPVGEKLPIALLKFTTDHIVFGLTVVWLLLPMLFNVHSTQKSYGELEAEKEARAQAMVDEYGGKLDDYL